MNLKQMAEQWHAEWSKERGLRIAADTRIAELQAQLEAARKDAKEDAERVKWMLPLLGGDDSPEADKRTLLLANELMRGKSGLEAIDAALEATTPEKQW